MSETEADLLGSLTETGLYSIGAFFADRHPELCDDVIAEAQAIEDLGLAAWAEREATTLDARLPDARHRSGRPLLQGRRGHGQLDWSRTSGRGAAW